MTSLSASATIPHRETARSRVGPREAEGFRMDAIVVGSSDDVGEPLTVSTLDDRIPGEGVRPADRQTSIAGKFQRGFHEEVAPADVRCSRRRFLVSARGPRALLDSPQEGSVEGGA